MHPSSVSGKGEDPSAGQGLQKERQAEGYTAGDPGRRELVRRISLEGFQIQYIPSHIV